MDGFIRKIDSDKLASDFVNKGKSIFESRNRSDEEWNRLLSPVAILIDRIKSKDGEVLAVRLNDGAEFREMYSRYFPRERYWDMLSKELSIRTIHYLDYPELLSFAPPDELHLSGSDIERFTVALAAIIKRSNALGVCSE